MEFCGTAGVLCLTIDGRLSAVEKGGVRLGCGSSQRSQYSMVLRMEPGNLISVSEISDESVGQRGGSTDL